MKRWMIVGIVVGAALAALVVPIYLSAQPIGGVCGGFIDTTLGACKVVNQNVLSAQGPDSQGGPIASNPMLQGCLAVAHGSNPSEVTANTLARCLANRAGIQFTIAGHPNIISTEWTFSVAPALDTALITVSAGTKIVPTLVQVTTGNDMSSLVAVRIGCGAVALPTESTAGVTGILASSGGLPPGRDLTSGNGSGMVGVCADGEDVRIQTSTISGGKLRVVIKHYTVSS